SVSCRKPEARLQEGRVSIGLLGRGRGARVPRERLCPPRSPTEALGHESQIEGWFPPAMDVGGEQRRWTELRLVAAIRTASTTHIPHPARGGASLRAHMHGADAGCKTFRSQWALTLGLDILPHRRRPRSATSWPTGHQGCPRSPSPVSFLSRSPQFRPAQRAEIGASTRTTIARRSLRT